MAKKKGKNKGYTIDLTKSGKFQCRQYVDLPNGIRKQISATGETEKIALENLKKKYAQIWQQGKVIRNNGYTVKSWCEYWLKDIKTNLKGNTKDSYYFSFKNHIFPLLGKIKLKNLTVLQIQSAINKVKEKKVIRNGIEQKITGKAVKEIFAPLKQALKFAMADDKMPHISLEVLNMPKVIQGTREIRTEEEQIIITDYFCNRIPNKPFDLYYAPIVIMDARGLRPEEVGGLMWEDINFAKDSFWAGRHTVVKNGVYDEKGNKIGDKLVTENSGKTIQAGRELPLGDFLSNIFKMKYQEYIAKGITPKATDYIFYTKAGNPFYEQSLRKMYKSLAKKLEISEIGCYSLRHEHCTFLAQETDTDTETICKLEGWKQIIPSYFHTNDKQKRNATSKIDKQYEDTSTTNNILSKKDNIIHFPVKKVVNK